MEQRNNFNIICATTGVGKRAFVAAHPEDVIYIDAKHTHNWIPLVISEIDKGKLVLLDSDMEVRIALQLSNLDYILMYPRGEDLNEYIQRWKADGLSEERIQYLIDNWDREVRGCYEDEYCQWGLAMPTGWRMSDVISQAD